MAKRHSLYALVAVSSFMLGMAGSATGRTIYVDANASGTNDGSNWTDAYEYLQNALAAAAGGDEIWIAEGTYRPDANTGDPGGTGVREATFRLVGNVELYGGFPHIPPLGSSASYGAALGDLDGDGDLDAFVVNYLQNNKVWVNIEAGGLSGDGDGENSSISNLAAVRVVDTVCVPVEERIWVNQILQAGPALVDVDPLANSHTAGVGTEVSATFDENIDPASVSDQTFVVHGMQTGMLCSPPSTVGASGDTVTLSPAQAFGVGELVQATATTGIQGLGGEGLLSAFVWQFRTAVGGGSGLFEDSGQDLGGPACSSEVALGDVDGDGDPDAFVVCYNGSDKVWLNDGGGHFSDSGQSLGSLDNSSDVALGDVDGDGNLDAFVANCGFGNDVWLNDGTGTFSDSGQSLGSSESYSVALGDLDGDGDLDAFVANHNQGNRVWFSDGQGTFADSGQSLGNSASRDVALGDLDGDGDLDAFVANDGQANKVWPNNGAGTYADSGQNLGSSNSYDIILADLDGDGDVDAFVANHNQGNRVWFSDGQGTFADSGQSLGNSASRDVALGDIDGDGDLDAFVANDGQANKVWLNDGQGVFSESAGPGLEHRNWRSFETVLSGDIGTPGDNTDNSYHVVTGSGTDSTAILDGFVIAGGNADGSFPHNSGGGMYNHLGSPTLVNCIFRANTASGAGGGMHNYVDCSPTLTNCSFSGNRTGTNGGAIFNFSNSDTTLTNCTFSRNSASFDGGGVYNQDSSPIFANCILWGNMDIGAEDESAQVYDLNSTPVINHCCVQGWSGILGGAGNIGDCPLFADFNGPDDMPGTADDDLRLLPGSSCVDAGDNSAVSHGVVTDLDGWPRFMDGDCNGSRIVDMGAYEFAWAYVGDFDGECDVDLADFAILALAWSAEPGDARWNPDCDISIPADDKIDWADVDVLTDNWLAGL